MDFSLNDEQQMIVKTTRQFVVNELYPHEKEVEETGALREDLHRELKAKAIEAGLYAANMPADVGGGGLDTVTWVLYEKELGRTNYALHYSCVGRPSNSMLEFSQCRVPKAAILGELHRGFEVANTWLGSTRLQVAATCLGRAERALECAKQWAVDRVQFGQQIGKFQGVSFKLADMALELRAAELLTLEAAWKLDQKLATDMDMAIAKLKATEMLAMVADEALQIHGGMGLMSDLPLERIWRDARIERIWEGTSEVQRHIISRALLRPLGG